jgi:hypothetical protein
MVMPDKDIKLPVQKTDRAPDAGKQQQHQEHQQIQKGINNKSEK